MLNIFNFKLESLLLTGSHGFIGSFLNKAIDYKFIVANRVFDEKSRNEHQILISDLSDSNKSLFLFEKVEVVIHLGGLAHNPTFSVSEYESVNVNNTLQLATLSAKAGVKRFVFVSSIVVNGTSTTDVPFSHVSKENPHNAYAQSKYDAEMGLKKIADDTGMELVIVRPTLVYGPNAPGNFGALTRLINKVPFLPFGLVHNKRDFISVQNLADLLVTCAKHPNAGGHIFLASENETVSIKVFTNSIAKGLNKKIIQLPVPVSLMRLNGKLFCKSAMVEQLLGNLQVDSSNIKEILDWTPPYTMEQSMAFLQIKNKSVIS